jgi:uncharacterized membrane protein
VVGMAFLSMLCGAAEAAAGVVGAGSGVMPYLVASTLRGPSPSG